MIGFQGPCPWYNKYHFVHVLVQMIKRSLVYILQTVEEKQPD